MKILKRILVGLTVLLGLLLIVGLFLPSEFHVERRAEIAAPVDSVFKLVENTNNLVQWNPWSELDPESKNETSTPPTGVGAYWYWDGEIIGKGSMTLAALESNKSLEYILRFDEPKMDPSDILFKFSATATGTEVVWINVGKLNYPIGRYFGLMMDSMLGSDFEKGLANLKAMAEKR